MAFTTIPNAQIAAGEPTKQELFQLVKDNFDNHETRIANTEAFTTATIPFFFQILNSSLVGDGLAHIRLPVSITVSGVKVTVPQPGTAGTLTIDIERKVGAGAWSSILSSTISVVYTAGIPTVTADAGIAIPTIAAGSFLRLNVDSSQAGLKEALIEIEYTVTV